MNDYYKKKLAADNLEKCYEIAPPRVKQYLTAEISFVLDQITPHETVLDLGCGFGRVLPAIAQKAQKVVGIDNSHPSLLSAKEASSCIKNCFLIESDAAKLAFKDNIFDLVSCIQNGISAFHVDQKKLLAESIRVAKPGGTILFSSYSEKFWHHRLEWFKIQSNAGLLGEIDFEKTGNGVIICKDGFKAVTFGPAGFLSLAAQLGVSASTSIIEIDESSIFCVIRKD